MREVIAMQFLLEFDVPSGLDCDWFRLDLMDYIISRIQSGKLIAESPTVTKEEEEFVLTGVVIKSIFGRED